MPGLLNARQERFAQAMALGHSPSAAYRLAGYSAHSSFASKLAKSEAVRERVRELLDSAAERVGVSSERVLRELSRIAFADIRDLVEWRDEETGLDEDGEQKILPAGVWLKRSDAIADDIAAAIAEVVPTSHGPRVKLHDKRAALIDLGKHLGIFETAKSDGARQGRRTGQTVSDQPAADGADDISASPPMSEQDWEKTHGGDEHADS